jgi:hypothetical protein
MPDRQAHPGPDYPFGRAARDPMRVQLYLRDLRIALVKAQASALLLLLWRHIAKLRRTPVFVEGEQRNEY